MEEIYILMHGSVFKRVHIENETVHTVEKWGWTRKKTAAAAAMHFSIFLLRVLAILKLVWYQIILCTFVHRASCNEQSEFMCACVSASSRTRHFTIFICFTWTRKISSYEIPFYFAFCPLALVLFGWHNKLYKKLR